MDTFSEFKFTSTYYLAAHVREKILDNAPEEYLTDHFDINNEDFQNRLLKPDKWTILHDFIEYEFTDGIEYVTRKLGNEQVENDWKKYLNDYKIPFPTEEEFNDSPDAEEGDYVTKLSELVIEHVTKFVVEETFTVLFGDRFLLMEYNKILASLIVDLEKSDYDNLLERDGVIKRCTYFNEWVKRAVFYRDKGLCAICLADLSGLLRTDFKDAIDHIVPLNLGGSNDITNLQLICQKCNLEKLGHTIRTSEKYSKYY